jgi:hypothetical protein
MSAKGSHGCLALVGFVFLLEGCQLIQRDSPPAVAQEQRPAVAVLEFGFGVEINSLSSVKSLNGDSPLDKDPEAIAQAVREIRREARRLLHEDLAKGGQFVTIPIEDVDRVAAGLDLQPGLKPTASQLEQLRSQLHADLAVGGIVQDYGKVRWQWLAAGMLGDMTWESLVIGAATSWNPAAIFGNIGFELLTSTPVWFGGGYLFGIAFRPVRVEAWAVETKRAETAWESMDVSIYLWKRLKELPEEERKKKEVQLHVNLTRSMEALGESLREETFTKRKLWELGLPAQPSLN